MLIGLESPGASEGRASGVNEAQIQKEAIKRDREEVLSLPLWPHILVFLTLFGFQQHQGLIVAVITQRAGAQLADVF